MSVLKYSAVGILIFVQLAVTYVLSQENLPFLTCCVLISCNLWNTYRSFTKKYHDLPLKFLEEYNQLTDSACDADLNMRDFTSDDGRTVDNMKRIPKELFDMACEDLMPITKSFSLMVLKATLSVIFVLAVFSFTMLLTASPVMRTLLTFVAGSFPKIVTIYVERRRKRNLKAVPIDDKARKVAFEYINISSPCNQGEKLLCVYPKKDELKGGDRLDHLAFCVISITAYFSFWGFPSV